MKAKPFVADMDGMEHTIGGDCCIPQVCRKCGGREHFQGIYGSYIELCEECDRGDFHPPAYALRSTSAKP